MNILFVDDEPDQLDIIKDYAKDLGVEQIFHSISYDSAIKMNADHRFDGAIIDLRLNDKQGRTGKELARYFIREAGIPCVILSGNPQDVVKEFAEFPNFKVCNKLKHEYGDAVKWFVDQSTMLDAMREMRNGLNKKGALLFSRNLWPRWSSYLSETKDDPSKLGQMILRQCAGYIAEEMNIGTSPAWHSFEAYFEPSLRHDRAHTGDIFKLDGKFWVILSPQCDMALQKVPTVLFAVCTNEEIEDWEKAKANFASGDEGKIKKGRDTIGSFIGQGKMGASKHFLPPFGGTANPLIVDFGIVKVVTMPELEGLLPERVASLSPALIPNLTQRFGAYISRTGQPNFDPGHV